MARNSTSHSGRCFACGQTLPQPGQADLFAQVPPSTKSRRRDPDPSRDAARLAVVKQGTQRYRLLEALEAAPGTAEELAVRTRLPYVSASTRLTELVRPGFAEVVGERKTAMRARANVVGITNEGRRALARERSDKGSVAVAA